MESSESTSREITVAVSGINAIDNPGPGIGVARSLKEESGLSVKIVGLAYDAMEPGLYMDWMVDRSFIMAYPSGSGEALVDRLLYIKAKAGLDVVIPGLDAELPLYIKWASTLAEHGIHSFLPTMEQFRLRGKDRLADIAEHIGIEAPRTLVVNSLDGLFEAVDELKLPVMVKGCFCKAYRAYTSQEAASQYRALVSEWGHPVIVQQVVTGDEMNLIGLGDGDGGLLGAVGIKKISVTAQGKIWTGVTVKNPSLLTAAEKFAHEYRWRGPFEMEYIVDHGRVQLLEVNPRFPAWCYFATAVGVNLPARMVRHVLGLPVAPVDDYEAGKLFVRYTYELITDMTSFQNAITKGETP